MSLLNNPIDVRYEGRTQSQLVVSEGNAPAEKWLPTEALNAAPTFEYAFGPENNKEVVIPKGKIVTTAGVEYDSITEKYIPRIAICTDSTIPMGVNHHNVYQRKRDRFSGNAPTVITRDYIRVPLFVNTTGSTAQDAATAIKFGAMWAEVSGTTKAAIATAVYGSYVVSDAYGNFTIPTTLATSLAAGLVIGQVMGVELDIAPAGYLQYFTEMTDGELYDLIQASQEFPSPGRLKASDLSVATIPSGTSYLKDKESLAYILKNFRAGIPFLTDGYFKSRTAVTISALASGGTMHSEILEVKAVGCTINADATKTLTVTEPQGAMIFIKLKDKLDATFLQSDDVVANHPELNGVATSLIVKIDGTALSTNDYHVDYANNMIVIYPSKAYNAKAIGIVCSMLVSQIPGIPTNWDFSGCYGEARILLNR